MMRYFSASISSVRTEGPGYYLLTFACDPALEGAPGQFVMIRGAWGYDPILPRAFSIVRPGAEAAVLVRDVGRGTHLLGGMRAGDPLYVLGPLGTAFAPDARRRPVLVAGGVGVAPLVYLAEDLVRQGQRPVFVYGGRTHRDLPMLGDVEALCDVRVTTEDGSAGMRGRVTDALAVLDVADGAGAVYACGPHPMLRAVHREAHRRGWPTQVALEAPMACGMGTCKGCVEVGADGSFRYVCTDGPVFDGADIFGKEADTHGE